jgi:hypothetical protein
MQALGLPRFDLSGDLVKARIPRVWEQVAIATAEHRASKTRLVDVLDHATPRALRPAEQGDQRSALRHQFTRGARRPTLDCSLVGEELSAVDRAARRSVPPPGSDAGRSSPDTNAVDGCQLHHAPAYLAELLGPDARGEPLSLARGRGVTALESAPRTPFDLEHGAFAHPSWPAGVTVPRSG